MKTPNTSQAAAIAHFTRIMEDQCHQKVLEHNRVHTTSVEDTDHGVFWITSNTDVPSLGEGSYLRFLEQDHWFVMVGKRGALTAHQYPQSLKQFKGTQWCGINIK